jgi:transketolase
MEKKFWITETFTSELIKFAKKNKKIIVLDADLADDLNLYSFKKEFPQRFIQNGIAEQDMVSTAGGLALLGFVPVVNSFASFLSSRANEQIYNNATELTKIIYINLYAGLIPAGAGKSHQSIRDLALISSIPNFKIYHPINYLDTPSILKHCIFKEKKNSCIRLNIGPPPIKIKNLQNIKFIDGEGTEISKGGDIIVFTFGQYILNEVLGANEIFKKKNIKLSIVNISSLNFFNIKWFMKILKNKKQIFVIEDNFQDGGFGNLFLSFLVKNQLLENKKYFNLALNDFPECGTTDEVLNYHNLTSQKIYNHINLKVHEKNNR